MLLAGCAGTALNPHKRLIEFNEAEYAGTDRVGTATVAGQAFLVFEADGSVAHGSGSTVYLNPVTSYSTEWYEKAVVRTSAITEPDSRTARYRRQTTADAEGRFRFQGVPAGEFYVTSPISWSSNLWQYAHAKIVVRDGETVDVVVTSKVSEYPY
jgi:hypothetical protein